MARQKRDISEKYNSAFATRLRHLIKERNVTQDALATYIGVTRQTVSQYVNGISDPSFETLGKIADYFNVTTDYLLGRTDDPSLNPSAVDDLGLPDSAIGVILKLQNNPLGHRGLNYLLNTSDFYYFICYFGRFLNEIDELKEKYDIIGQLSGVRDIQERILDEYNNGTTDDILVQKIIESIPEFFDILSHDETGVADRYNNIPVQHANITLHKLQKILNRITDDYIEAQGVILP